MFGLDSNTLAFIALAGFSGAALVYALLFQKIEEENRTGKRPSHCTSLMRRV